MALSLRTVLGRRLTWQEGDDNFLGLSNGTLLDASALAAKTFTSLALSGTLSVVGAATFSGSISFGGQILAANGSAAAPSFAFTSAPAVGWWRVDTSTIGLGVAGFDSFRLGTTSGHSFLQFSRAASASNSTTLFNDAANTLALRNATNPNAFRIYNTFTDLSNYERVALYWTANVVKLAAQVAGTGLARNMQVINETTGEVQIGTNNTVRWVFGSSGHLVSASSADNLYDIGASGATRPRSMYLGTSLRVGPGSTDPFGAIGTFTNDTGAGTNVRLALQARDSGNTTNVVAILSAEGSQNHVLFGSYSNHHVTIRAGNLEQCRIGSIASAVNYVHLLGAATAGFPSLFVAGSDTNIGQALSSKGTGDIRLLTSAGTVEQVRVLHVASAVNRLVVFGNATAARAGLQGDGSDVNVGLQYIAKGTGVQTFTTASGASEQFRVGNAASTVNYVQAQGNATGSFPHLRGEGSDVNVGLAYVGKATGGHDFYTGSTVKQFGVVHIASAVNYIYAQGSVAGGDPGLIAAGSDASVTIAHVSKGSGSIDLITNGSSRQFRASHVASVVNYTQVSGRATGNGPITQVVGSDTNVDMILSTKGTGGFGVFTNATAQKQFEVTHTASAVNFWRATGSATGASMTISAQGSDTNITANIASKGTGIIQLLTNGGAQLQAAVAHVASAVNYVQLAGGATGNTVTISAQGSDSNVDLTITGKGTGVVVVDDDLRVTGATILQNSQSAAYTAVAADANKHIYHPVADNNARTFTIPANSSVAYAIGTCLTFINEINTVTIAITTDTLVLAGTGATGSRTLAANGVATAVKVTSTRWVISGTGLT